MERKQFDTLARLVATKQSRRAALATLLAATLLRTDPSAVLAKGKGRVKAQAKAKTKRKPCYPGGTHCVPSKGKNTSGCDFTSSTAFFAGDFRGANLSDSNFTGAQLAEGDFRGANLSGACLVGANLLGVKLGASANLDNAIFCRTLMPDGTYNDRDCGNGARCCPASFRCESEQCPAECIGAPNAQCSPNVPYGGCCPGLHCVPSSTTPIRFTCQAPCGDDRVCHRFGAAWHCAFEPEICRYLRGECCQHI